LTDAEIDRLAAFKGVSEHDFIRRFTRLRHDRRGLVLQEKPDGSCVFLDGNDCSVQPVKPQQCRDFPNLWNFPGFEMINQAPGVDILVNNAYLASATNGTALRVDGGVVRGTI
jgi:Fe-S-cluster containining protein